MSFILILSTIRRPCQGHNLLIQHMINSITRRSYNQSRVFGFNPEPVSSHGTDLQLKRSKADHRVRDLVTEYRRNGHYLASEVNPLTSCRKVQMNHYKDAIDRIREGIIDLKEQVLANCSSILTAGLFNCPHIEGSMSSASHDLDTITANELIQFLDSVYGDGTKMSIEFMHIPDEYERSWIAKEFESLDRTFNSNKEETFAKLMLESEVLELFMAKKYPSVKRYSGEGSESMSVFFRQLLHDLESSSCSSSNGSNNSNTEVFIGMAHRGRLPLLIQHLKYPPAQMFRKMAGGTEVDLGKYPNSTGDVLSHLFIAANVSDNVKVTLLPNPSHLEAVSPVAVGASRATALKHGIAHYYDLKLNGNRQSDLSPLAVQVHGDGSFTGQGIVMETLAMSRLPHFSVDGSVHLIVNNQLGYTTPSDRGRSSYYASDLMKMIESPVIHVNGSDPSSVALSASLALKYRNRFKKDILVDMLCYRKHGHNELDEPSFTNPIMYQEIDAQATLPTWYGRKVLEEEEFEAAKKNYGTYLNDQFKLSQEKHFPITDCNFQSEKLERAPKDAITTWDTGYDLDKLRAIGNESITIPTGFKLHPTLTKSLVESRRKALESGDRLDWATAEALAIGSLLDQGLNVRLCGQDVGRGTFSQRHAMIVNQETGQVHIPLNELNNGKSGLTGNSSRTGQLEVVNSLLSEEAVLAFEYGFSVVSPEATLSIWEAQFGDFFNGAQIIFDTMISSGELKWTLESNLVILLPHGFDGAGPEHSSCRIERFLQMSDSEIDSVDADDVNMVIVNPTTPGQYFHLIRRQMVRGFKKPLIVAAPKILLRHPGAVSSLDSLATGQHFEPVIDDSKVTDHSVIKTLILCSGKHFYALDKERKEKNHITVAIVRLEELSPFPMHQLINIINKYNNAIKIVWAQEEHQNAGCWSHVETRFRNFLRRDIEYAGRRVLGSPATGLAAFHKEEATEIVRIPFLLN